MHNFRQFFLGVEKFVNIFSGQTGMVIHVSRTIMFLELISLQHFLKDFFTDFNTTIKICA